MMPSDPFDGDAGAEFRAVRDAMRDALERGSLVAAVGALDVHGARV